MKLARDFVKYLRAVFIESGRWFFSLLDLVSVALFVSPLYVPNLSENGDFVRLVSVGMLVVSFALANFTLYRKLSEQFSETADIRLEVEKYGFDPSHGQGPPPVKGIVANQGGYDGNGVPDWASLWAGIDLKNVGYKDGDLQQRTDLAKTKLPSLFETGKADVHFENPMTRIGGHKRGRSNYFFNVPITIRDPRAFARALRTLVKANRQYRIVIAYNTRHIFGESEERQLVIRGDFKSFYEKVLKHWEDNRLTDLADLARLK